MTETFGLCWLAEFVQSGCSGGPGPEGVHQSYQRAHLIDKQRMRQAGIDREDTWDRRIWRWCCVYHHRTLDGPWFKLKREQYPDSVKEWADEHGFFWSELDQTWLPEAVSTTKGEAA